MSKSFLLLLFCLFILVCYLFCDFWTLIIIVFVFFTLIKCILIWYEYQLNVRRKPGTVSHSKVYLIGKKYFKPELKTRKLNISKHSKFFANKSDNIFNSNYKTNLKVLNRQINNSSFDSGVFSQSCQTEMSFFKSSNSSLSLIDSSPVRRPLRIRNGEQLEGSPIRNTSLTTLTNTSVNESRSQSGNMSVGEFPLISLVSSLHEAVSPKPHRLQPSPVRIRIKPVQQTEQMVEPVADPVVSVLKQIASNKRILAPNNVTTDEEKREKKSRSMPRHDLTHSLLESQLTINSSREAGGNSSKREREETICSSSTPCGVQSASVAKRMCARTLRSNEILSSLSSSISLVSPPSNKPYTGKRKSVTFDKYKKVRRIDEAIQVKSASMSPVKVDKAVTTQPPEEKPPLPVISIKRDIVSERVVSRAMVSALLKSTVAKLISSGDPAVYPIPNGTQSRQPEVTPTEFGPLKPPPTLTSTPSLSSEMLLPPASGLTFSMPQSDKTSAVVSSSQLLSPGFNFGSQTSSATLSATSHTLTTSVPSLSTSSSSPSQPLFSVNKPQVSTAAVPTFGLSTSTGLTTPSISTAQVGVTSTPSVVSTAPPSFSIPSSTILNTSSSPAIPVFGSGQSPSKPPSFGLTTSTNATTIPTFGLSSSVVSTTSTTPTFSFGSSQATNETKTTTSIAPPSFASVVASSTPSFGLLPATTPAMSTTASSSLFSPVATSNAPTIKFGATTNTAAPVFGATTTSTVAPPTFGGALPTSSAITSTAATPVFGSASNTSAPLFGSNLNTAKAATPSTTAPSTVFGAATPVFGGTTSTTTPLFGANTPTTTSSNIFGANPITPAFGSNSTTSAPVFGSSTVTTAAPLFGGPANTATTSIFGSFTNTNTTTSTPLFGTTSTTSSAPLFGAGVSTTTATPLFGANSATVTPIFGGTSSTTAPVFGATATKTTTAPVFGGSTSIATSSTPLFGGSTTTTSQAPMFGSSAPSFTSSGFGGPSAAKPSEGLFGMPSSNSGFKASSPFQVGGTDGGNTTSAFGAASAGTAGKTFEFGSSKPSASAGGFTFKPNTTVTPFSSQPAAPQQSTATPFNQPSQQAPFSFAGAASSSTGANTGGSPFVFGTPQSQPAAPAAGAKPFQFGTGTPGGATPAFGAGTTGSAAPAFGSGTAGTAAPAFGSGTPGGATPAFGQSFTPTFGQSPAAPNVSFGTPSTPANAGFQFNTPQQPAPGAGGGLFSIGTGSTGSRNRDRRDRRRRV